MSERAEKDRTFDEIVNEFEEVQRELERENLLQKYSATFNKLLRTFKKLHNKRLMLSKQCQELKDDIEFKVVQRKEDQKRILLDEETIRALKREVKQVWCMVDVAHEKEKEYKKVIQTLHEEHERITALAPKGLVSFFEFHNVDELVKITEELTAERDELRSELQTLQCDFEALETRQSEAVEANVKAQDLIIKLEYDVQAGKSECSKYSCQKEKLEKELTQLRAENKTLHQETKTLTAQCQHSNDELQRVAQKLQEQKRANETISMELERVQGHDTKLQHEKEQSFLRLDLMTAEIEVQAADLKAERDTVIQMKEGHARLNKEMREAQKKLVELKEQKSKLEEERDTLKNQIAGQEKEMETANKQAGSNKKEIKELTKDKEKLMKNVMKAEKVSEKTENKLKLIEQVKETMNKEILKYRDERTKQQKTIHQLKKEKERYTNKNNDLIQKIQTHMKELKVKDLELENVKKENSELKMKLELNQKLHEAARTEGHNYSKNLLDAQKEIKDMKRKIKSMNHEYGQLTVELKSKEVALVKVHKELKHMEKEKQELKAELQRIKLEASETMKNMDYKEAEVQRLLKTIASAEAQNAHHKKELDQVISDRDNLRTQILRRNNKCAQLHDKIKVQGSILNSGKIQYDSSMEENRLLKLESKNLLAEKSAFRAMVSEMEALRQQVKHLEKELSNEQAKRKGLQNKLENPGNFHTWRELEANNLSAFETLRENQCVKRDLIALRQEITDKERLIQEKEKQCTELKNKLDRLNPATYEQLVTLQVKLRAKNEQNRALRAELNMTKSLLQEYKHEKGPTKNGMVPHRSTVSCK